MFNQHQDNYINATSGILKKSHPESEMLMVNSGDSTVWRALFCEKNPTIKNCPVVILQVMIFNSATVLVEYIDRDKYNVTT